MGARPRRREEEPAAPQPSPSPDEPTTPSERLCGYLWLDSEAPCNGAHPVNNPARLLAWAEEHAPHHVRSDADVYAERARDAARRAGRGRSPERGR